MEIFDKQGNVLGVENIVYDYIKNKANKCDIDILDFYVSAYDDSIYLSKRCGWEYDETIVDIKEIKLNNKRGN